MSPLVVLGVVLLLSAAANGQGYAFNTSTTSGLITNPFSTFVIIAYPPCTYTGKTASLTLSGNITRTENFTVPDCRFRRDVVNLQQNNAGFTFTKNIGYKLVNLTAGQTYSASYVITDTSNPTSRPIFFSTVKPTNYQDIPTTMARSGGMVVITVLLSIAMAILVVSLVIMLVLGKK